MDHDLVPLLLQENFIDAVARSSAPAGPKGMMMRLERLARASDSFADSDVIKYVGLSRGVLFCYFASVSPMWNSRLPCCGSNYVRADGHWSLLPAQAALNVRAGGQCCGFTSFPRFPGWLGQNSKASRRSRLLRELTMHLGANITGGSQVGLNFRHRML